MLGHRWQKGAPEGDGFLMTEPKRQHVPVVEAKTQENTGKEIVRDRDQRAARLQFRTIMILACTVLER